MKIKPCVLFYYFSSKDLFFTFPTLFKNLPCKLTVKFLFNELFLKIDLYLALQLQNLTLRLGTNPSPPPSSFFWVKPYLQEYLLSIYLIISIEDIVVLVSNQKVLISVNVLYFNFSI